jgi:hypothetical protein
MSVATITLMQVFMKGSGYFCLISNKWDFHTRSFINIKFYETPSNEKCANTCRHTDRQVDMMEVIGVFGNYGNMLKMSIHFEI